MAGLKQVAQQAGVSRATAARAFATPELVRESTRSRIFEAADALNFRPNRLAQQLRQQSTRLIGVVLPSLLNPVFAEQLHAMEQAAREQGYALLIATTDYCANRERDMVEDLLRQRVDGLVLTVADADGSELLKRLAAESTPFALAYHQPSQPYASVYVDNHQGMATATRHLLKAGHTKIAMVTGPALQSDRARRRVDGYRAAMRAHGLTPLPVIEMPAHTAACASVMTEQWTRLSPTALLCSNDLLAISVIGVLQRSGYKVPDDISVVGFDGIALGEQLYPSLCTVVQPIEQLGRTLIAEILAQLEGDAPRHHCLACRIRPGESSNIPLESLE
ncbi:substrate-binding domain-containing protein [Pseudomonas matsuisoli]|uniref:GntR family transcriptional regulator n=1 Tax=Pseudomonas matsuisoli TaxID=1515666 RepID=A0A917PR58_9PSED|nr:substrate-binding domain-containing protein [Pseudomonas matsuisoli]GGJ88902.1 GntR family transcriptional regulator [Pseudomonas matsuisoli]